MDIFIVMEDLGDGDVALLFFETPEEAATYMEGNEYCHYESNPRHIKVDKNFVFNRVREV